jgi:hypothetical protein
MLTDGNRSGRPIWREGRTLEAEELRAEQHWRELTLARHRGVAHGTGILSGLEVSADGSSVEISRGVAVAQDGTLLVTKTTQRIDIHELKEGGYKVVLARQEGPHGDFPWQAAAEIVPSDVHASSKARAQLSTVLADLLISGDGTCALTPVPLGTPLLSGSLGYRNGKIVLGRTLRRDATSEHIEFKSGTALHLRRPQGERTHLAGEKSLRARKLRICKLTLDRHVLATVAKYGLQILTGQEGEEPRLAICPNADRRAKADVLPRAASLTIGVRKKGRFKPCLRVREDGSVKVFGDLKVHGCLSRASVPADPGDADFASEMNLARANALQAVKDAKKKSKSNGKEGGS